MDNKSKIIFDAKNQLIDSNLKNEIKRIKRTYSPIKHFGSLEMNQRIAMSEAQANEARKLALWELERDLQSTIQIQTSDSGKLTFYNDGESIYFAPSGKKYEARLDANTNGYKLLNYLIAYPLKEFDAKHLEKFINDSRKGSGADEDRRIRDTIQKIRVAFGLIKNNMDDFFIVNHGLYGIKCEVEIKQHKPQTSSK